ICGFRFAGDGPSFSLLPVITNSTSLCSLLPNKSLARFARPTLSNKWSVLLASVGRGSPIWKIFTMTTLQDPASGKRHSGISCVGREGIQQVAYAVDARVSLRFLYLIAVILFVSKQR